jgi:hypothetical protein
MILAVLFLIRGSNQPIAIPSAKILDLFIAISSKIGYRNAFLHKLPLYRYIIAFLASV